MTSKINNDKEKVRHADILESILLDTEQVSNDQLMVYDMIPAEKHDEQVASYDDSFRESTEKQESIYGKMEAMPSIIQAAHERRIEILNNLPIGDISEKICVDYGVGSWGYACIFPRLHACRFAIGIDISYEAIKESAKISALGKFPYGDNYFYITSRGDDIRLKDQSVDIFFTGECIEHVENTDAFLDEIHRILTPNGMLILTTPNADAYLYQVQGERYGVGPEHVALMGYRELHGYLNHRFEILNAKGFNGSFHYTLDNKIEDLDFSKNWASLCAEQPELGTGVVVMARRRNDYESKRYVQQFHHHSSPEIIYEGPWHSVHLHKSMTGKLAMDDQSNLKLIFSGNGIILNFWSHDWSGKAQISVDGVNQIINLYNNLGGFARVCIPDLSSGEHLLEIKKYNDKDPRSYGRELIFYQAITYEY